MDVIELLRRKKDLVFLIQ